MIPEELRTAIEETEDAENDIIRRPDTIISHNTPQGRVKTLQIRLTDDEYSRLAELAGNKPVSAIARNLLVAVTRDNPEQLLAQQALQEALESAGYRITKAA